MATNYVKVKGIIKDGRLIVDLPENAADGEIEIPIPVKDDEAELSPAELEDYFQFKGLPFGEIEIGGWEDMRIEDSAEFVDEAISTFPPES
ncbi:MAG: hypothetical protein K8L99_25605 [Anaerolineae bacterium]|nr:hypothetical protein [Anaerolineae bacterium]